MTVDLLSLPLDILVLLPQYIHNIEDFTSFTSTCRTLRTLASSTSPQQILRLCSASAPVFFSPHPHFLIAATIHSVTSAVRSNPTLHPSLIDAFRDGVDGLYSYCMEHGSLTLNEIRHWHSLRFSTLNPLIDAIDKMAGQQWISTPNFWDGGVSEADTLYCESSRVAFQLVIYAEAFGREGFDQFLEQGRGNERQGLDLATRLEYIKYCIPDASCGGGYPGFEVLQTGPYTDRAEREQMTTDQASLHHVLKCSRWGTLWLGILQETGGSFLHYDDSDDSPTQEQPQQEQEIEDRGQERPEADLQRDFDEDVVYYDSADSESATTDEADAEEEMISHTPADFSEINSCEDMHEWKERLWVAAVMFSAGVGSLKVAMEYSKTQQMTNEDKQRLIDIRRKISELGIHDAPRGRNIGTYLRRFCSESPNPLQEVGVCVARRWPGATKRW